MKEKAFSSIDVVILTKNSEHLLEKCLNSLYKNVPVKRLIVVDGFSEDKTLDILERYNQKFSNIKIIQDKGTRATARQKGIEAVKTDWFLFLDSDVILCKDWFKKAFNYTEEKVGMIWGVNLDLIPNLKNRLFYRLLKKVSIKCFKIRGGLHDTLICRDAVKGIKIPEYLHHYEDYYIMQFVLKKGYSVVIPNDLYCFHIRPKSDWNWKESLKLAFAEINYGLFKCYRFSYMLSYPFFSLYWFLQRLNRKKKYLKINYSDLKTGQKPIKIG
jgi:glycosyltransferase involved in cell wall biosynthesis